MANPTVTAADVLQSANATVVQGVLGATATQGSVVYKDTANSNVWKLAQCDGTALEAGSGGVAICLTSGVSGQKCLVATADAATSAALDPGFAATQGEVYVVSATAGAIGIDADLVSTNRLTIIGVGNADGTLALSPRYTASVLP